MKISVILPTYIEKENIVELVNAINIALKADKDTCEVIIVDDNSPDKTGLAAREYFKTTPWVKVIIREKERGLATAIKTGILNSTGDILVIMDADFNHDPQAIPAMLEFLPEYDMVVGSRFSPGGGMENRLRHICSHIFNHFLQAMLRVETKDNLSGFFTIRKEKLREIDLDSVMFGYGDYFIRLLFEAHKKKFRVREIPVWYGFRRYGNTKTRFLHTLYQYTLAVLKLNRLHKEHTR